MIAALLLCLAPVVVDGDTVRCGTTKVRIFGVQAPERGSAGYSEAGKALAGLVGGGLVCEPKGTSFDRIVALCRNAGGIDVGKAQMDAGHAVEWCRYSANAYGTC